MKRISPLLFIDGIGIILAAVFVFALKNNPTIPTVINYIVAFATIIAIRLIFAGLVRIADSRLSDALKFCWVLLILLLPILGSIGALIVVDKKPY